MLFKYPFEIFNKRILNIKIKESKEPQVLDSFPQPQMAGGNGAAGLSVMRSHRYFLLRAEGHKIGPGEGKREYKDMGNT